MDSGDERRERGGRHARDLRERLEIVVRMLGAGEVVDLVVAQQHAERFAPGMTELLFVDLSEELALVELQGPHLVLHQLRPGEVQDPYLDHTIDRHLRNQGVQPSPGGFQLLEGGMMEDRVDLPGQQGIDPSDVAVELPRDLVPCWQGYGRPLQAEPQA